jgi:multicomponent Na+:H+ antiporter subunit E
MWIALWGDPSWGNVLGGAVVALIVAAAVVEPGAHRGTVRPLPALHFVLHVAWSLVRATTLVAWEVVTPRNRIVEGIIAVPLPHASPTVLLIVVNAIGLTPGTVVVEIDEDPCVLYVHVLHLTDIEKVRAELLHLDALALHAFGPPEAIAEIDRLEREVRR